MVKYRIPYSLHNSMAGAITLSIVYAIDVKVEGDPIVEVAEKGTESLIEIGNAGSYLGMSTFLDRSI